MATDFTLPLCLSVIGGIIIIIMHTGMSYSQEFNALLAKSADPLALACANDGRHTACTIIAGRK